MSLHAMLFLSDSALPLGSFAFSSGLESFLAHKKHARASGTLSQQAAFEIFIRQSIRNTASTAVPYVLSAWNSPQLLLDLDNEFDASTPCIVARRASIAQGRALLTLWERALSQSVPNVNSNGITDQASGDARQAVDSFTVAVKGSLSAPMTISHSLDLPVNAHFAPVFGSVCRACRLSASETAYIFLLNHAKAVLSAAVRASVIGPYQSQAILASPQMQNCISISICREQQRLARDAAVIVPSMDLWMGRHETLYSRIFNS